MSLQIIVEELIMKDLSKIIKEMGMENSFIQKEVIMMASGSMIKWRVMVYCIIKLVSWHMKANGLMIRFMVKEKSITISQQC